MTCFLKFRTLTVVVMYSRLSTLMTSARSRVSPKNLMSCMAAVIGVLKCCFVVSFRKLLSILRTALILARAKYLPRNRLLIIHTNRNILNNYNSCVKLLTVLWGRFWHILCDQILRPLLNKYIKTDICLKAFKLRLLSAAKHFDKRSCICSSLRKILQKNGTIVFNTKCTLLDCRAT